jgi:hypothetical protein
LSALSTGKGILVALGREEGKGWTFLKAGNEIVSNKIYK